MIYELYGDKNTHTARVKLQFFFYLIIEEKREMENCTPHRSHAVLYNDI